MFSANFALIYKSYTIIFKLSGFIYNNAVLFTVSLVYNSFVFNTGNNAVITPVKPSYVNFLNFTLNFKVPGIFNDLFITFTFML